MLTTNNKLQRVLVLAPQPFFQNRGTPIAVRLLVEELAQMGYEVHLLVFHEGEDLTIKGVELYRIPKIFGIKNIQPSLSIKKILCDIVLFFKAIQLLRRHKYTIVHAVEESVFLARIFKVFFNLPYIYDMDSSLAQQVVEKFSFLNHLGGILQFFEKQAIKGSSGVVAVCKALEELVLECSPEKLVVRLEDISLLQATEKSDDNLRENLHLSGPIMLYVGNLEKYQGIDLLLESFQLALQKGCQGNLVIIGGTAEAISAYKIYAEKLKINTNTFFYGPRPVNLLGHYLSQADILLSPRIKGNNTPMKLYSYLDSGKAVLATNLLTHTQVLQNDFACLVQPNRESMADGMVKLLENPDFCVELGVRGRKIAQDNYSRNAFRQKLTTFYQEIMKSLPQQAG